MLAKAHAAALVIGPRLVFGLVVVSLASAAGLPRVEDDFVSVRIQPARFVKVKPRHQPLECSVSEVVIGAVGVVIKPIPCNLANFRVVTALDRLNAHEHRARALNSEVLSSSRAHVIPTAVIAHEPDRISASPCRVVVVRIARECLRVFAGLLFQPQHGFDLGLDLVKDDRRLPALLQCGALGLG